MPRPNFAKLADPTGNPTCLSPPPIRLTKPATTYSDASSSYWPPGWNWERYSQATGEDRDSLPAGELEKLQAGLRDVLGEDGIGELAMFLFREEQRRAHEASTAATTKEDPSSGAQTASAPTATANIKMSPPDWLKQWRTSCNGQGWGFLAFKIADVEDARWEEFKKQTLKIATLPFERAKSGSSATPEYFSEAVQKFEICWVEDPDLVGKTPADLRLRYDAMRSDLPAGLDLNIFLCATSEVVDSVLSADTPTVQSRYWRADAPFLFALAAVSESGPEGEEGDEESMWFKPVFKVAVESMVEELWHVLASDMTSLHKITRCVKGAAYLLGEEGEGKGDVEGLDDIWWSMGPSPERLRKRRRIALS